MEEFVKEYAFYAMGVVLVLEYLLGSSKIIKPNSSIEAVLKVMVSIFKLVFGGKEEKK